MNINIAGNTTMTESCLYHAQMAENISRIQINTDKMIDGLFGSLDNTDCGFIRETQSRLQAIESRLGQLDNQRKFVSTAFWVVFGVAITAIAKAFNII